MKKKMFLEIMGVLLFLVIISTLMVPTAFATNATVVANATSGDCANVTFESEGDNYESYCVQHGPEHTVPDINTTYEVEENLSSTNVITEEQGEKIKIFAVEYRDTDLSHYRLNKSGEPWIAPDKLIDDVTSRQLVIWLILGQNDSNWYKSGHVNESVINHVNKLYDEGVRYADKGSFALNDTAQFNYTFKYFHGADDFQDFLGWLFAIVDIPPQNNETNNTTNETSPPPDETSPPENETPESPKEPPKSPIKKETIIATGNPLALLAFAGLGLGVVSCRRRRK